MPTRALVLVGLALVAGCAPSSPGAATTPPPGDSGVPTGTDTGTAPTSPAGGEAPVALSLNLHCLKQDGTPFASVAERLAHVAEQAVADGVTVLALQEVCRADGTDALALLEAALEAASGEPWAGAWAFAHVAWEGTPDEADEGVALLVRGTDGPLEAQEQSYVAPGALRRVGLGTKLADGPWVWSLHLDYDDAGARRDQGRQSAAAALAWADGPDVVVLGDLNDGRASDTVEAFRQMGFVDVGDGLPASRIDHAFVHRGAAWTGAAREVLVDPAVSDHPGVLLPLTPRAAEAVPVTRIDVRADVGFGAWVSVRGDAAPLSWEEGWWAVPVAADAWRLVLTEVEGGFAFKALVDDVSWQVGDDVQGTGGEAMEVWPSF